MTTRHRSVLAALALALLLCGRPQGAVAGVPRSPYPPFPVPAHAQRIIVKYRSPLSVSAQTLLAAGIAFATVTGRESLDRLNQVLGVTHARPLFFQQQVAADRRAAYFNSLALVRSRFPRRSVRIPAGATPPDLSNVFVLDIAPGMDVEQAAALYAADPDVEYAQPDYQVRLAFVPNDPFFSSTGSWGQSYPDLWGLDITQAASAWDTAHGSGTVIAVVDTGIDYNHPDLAANVWHNPNEIANNGIDDDNNGYVDDWRGWDFVQNANDPLDQNGHGTHVAGIAAAVGDNGQGVIGMAWGAQVMALRSFGANGLAYTSALAAAIDYAAKNGADVINASWGGFSFDLAIGWPSVLRDAIDSARSLGVVVVAAAGNDGDDRMDWYEPAGFPGVIAVGATQPAPADTPAAFSDYGNAMSVVAPGVDILSLLAGVSPVSKYGTVIDTNYLLLSGTSMATPHVSGLAALLLSAQPSLTPDEVRWHLELNADQPGYPGYEGQPWNPHTGWGRINAARVFDTPPVTTRLNGAVDLHTITGTVMPNVASADLSFTTLQSVDWSVTAPAWLPPAASSGSGPTQLSFSADATALPAGSYSGAITVGAPGTADGGNSLTAQLQVHRETRSGGVIAVNDNYAVLLDPSPLPTAGDGLGAVILNSDTDAIQTQHLYAERIDGLGNVTGPFLIDYPLPLAGTSLFAHQAPALAFDGRNYLAVWANSFAAPNFFLHTVNAIRLTPSGQPLDATPLIIDSRRSDGRHWWPTPQVGFDGKTYVVMWTSNMYSRSQAVYVRRVGTDGTLRGRRRRISPSKIMRSGILPQLACGPGNCLLAWSYRDGQVVSNLYVDKVYGVRLVDGAIVDTQPFLILSDTNMAFQLPKLTSNGNQYVVVAVHAVACPNVIATCAEDLVAARVDGNGNVLDTPEVTLNNGGPIPLYAEGRQHFFETPGLTFDGTNYVVTFLAGGSSPGTQVFASRLGPDGTVVDSEVPGLLLMPQSLGQALGIYALPPIAAQVTATATQTILSWADRTSVDWSTLIAPSVIRAQRVLSHPPACPVLAIGGIGPQTVAERSVLEFALSAPTLNPSSTTFSATNLPPGAMLDPTGVFRWMPAPDQARVYSPVHFAASDGTQTVSEDITITVSEANLSFGGQVTLADGTPVPGVPLQLRGAPGGVRLGVSGAFGYFEFADLVAGTYTVLSPRSSSYRATPSYTRVSLGTSDVRGLHIVVAPK